MKPIVMVDLQSQYQAIKSDIDEAIQRVITSCRFIKGPEVEAFEKELAEYLQASHVISCANGTDALMIALRALQLKPNSEVIVPTFTFIATAEVVSLLGLVPVFADVDPRTFLINTQKIESLITPRTRAIIPVHLFGQCAPMEAIMKIAERHGLYVIEDTAQALGANFTYKGKIVKAGTIGHMGATSFFPSKNLGCFGDGGALITNNHDLALRAKLIANHGSENKYFHLIPGVNSRLDALQAAILRTKLPHLDRYIQKRREAASLYISLLQDIKAIDLPEFHPLHTFNQFTLIIKNGQRDDLQKHLQQQGIPTAIYYPLPLHLQPAFEYRNYSPGSLPVSEQLSRQVLSLPMHTELDEEQIQYISRAIHQFFQ